MAVLLSACDKVFDVHPYDVRVKGEKGMNAKQAALIEKATLGKDTIRFAFISDTHQWFDETKAEIRDINRRKDSIDFVVHGGDITDFGGTREFEWSRDLLKGLSVPFVTLLGNHDCLGTGNQSYEVIFGDPDFSFIAGGVKFVCLNTNAIEYDYSRPVLPGKDESRSGFFHLLLQSLEDLLHFILAVLVIRTVRAISQEPQHIDDLVRPRFRYSLEALMPAFICSHVITSVSLDGCIVIYFRVIVNINSLFYRKIFYKLYICEI